MYSSTNRIMMIVENNQEELDNIRTWLAKLQLNVSMLTFDNPVDAWQYLLQAKNYGLLPELVFMELESPVMDGPEFMDMLHLHNPQAYQSTHFIMLSDKQTPQDLSRFNNIKAVIRKPLNESNLQLALPYLMPGSNRFFDITQQ